MTFGSLFAGVGGFDLGFERAGMTPVVHVERDANCRSILHRHWPDVACVDDVLKYRYQWESRYAGRQSTRPVRPDLICGGFPCQDVSVAGKRRGLAGERSGLWFVFRRIIALARPRWVCIENVDGLRSSNGGRDLGTILGQLGELGYWWAWRVFDSQYFGVAQRRRRVFIVGRLGAVRGRTLRVDRSVAGLPAQVLFESDSMFRDSPPRRQAKADVAACLTRGAASRGRGGYAGRRREDEKNVVCALDRHMGSGVVDDNASQAGHIVPLAFGGGNCSGPIDVSTCLTHHGMRQDFDTETFIAHTLRAEGFDASEDGTGRGTPIVPVYAIQERAVSENLANGPQGKGYQEGIGFTLEARSKVQAVAYQCHGSNVGPMGTLRVGNGNETGGVPFVPVAETLTASWHQSNGAKAGNNSGVMNPIKCGKAVRRLTPRECERLQGFPDDWTRWDANGNELSDSARYRMLGNAVTVNVAEWIARRIARGE